MKTFAKVLAERPEASKRIVLIEVILCDSSIYWRYSCESTVYLYKHECEYVIHSQCTANDALINNFASNFQLKLISYELL
jgi:hypothetical protein